MVGQVLLGETAAGDSEGYSLTRITGKVHIREAGVYTAFSH